MSSLNLVRLLGATAVVVLGLGACGDRVEDVVPEDDPPAAVATTVAQPERLPNDCGMRLSRPASPVRC